MAAEPAGSSLMARIVLHLHGLTLGGAERVALQWARWLAEAGHDVWLLLGYQQADAFFVAPEGINLVTAPASTGLTSVWLRRWLSCHPPDLAIGVTTRPAINLLLASLGQPWPVVVAERNYPPAKSLPWIWCLLRRWLYPTAHLHLVQTERIGGWLVRKKLARGFQVLANPLVWPMQRLQPEVDPASWLPDQARLLLSVGTKPDQKGFDRLIAAFERLYASYPQWCLALVGVSPDNPQLLECLAGTQADAPWRRRLLLPGAVGNLADWYQRASVFVLASRYEGFPNVLAEAMGSGCACVAIDCPTGPRELIDHADNGLLVPCVSEPNLQLDLLVENLSTVMADGVLRSELADRASSLRQRLAPERIRQQFLDLLLPLYSPRLLVFAPTRRSPTETFIRANLARMAMQKHAYFGDEFGFANGGLNLGQFAYGCSIVLSKLLTRLRCYRLATLPSSLVAYALIRWHRPRVILAEFGFHAVRMMDAALWSGTPLVVHFRGSDASADRRLVSLRERYLRLMHLASAFIVKSLPMQQTLVDLGARSSAITISPSGADDRLFTGALPAAALPVALFVGRFVEKKAPLDAVEAFALARDRLLSDPKTRTLGQQIRLTMVGDGDLVGQLKRLISELQLEKQVDLLGLQSPEAVANLMRASRCLLLPSKTASDGDSEGCPVVVQEAQVAGLPVVSTLHAGIPEVVSHGCTGLLSPEGDLEALADSLYRLFLDSALAGSMGAAAAEHSRSRFTVEAHIATVEAVLTRAALADQVK